MEEYSAFSPNLNSMAMQEPPKILAQIPQPHLEGQNVASLNYKADLILPTTDPKFPTEVADLTNSNQQLGVSDKFDQWVPSSWLWMIGCTHASTHVT